MNGCEPYKIEILFGDDRYQGNILTNYTDVTIKRSSLVLSPNARFAVKNPGTTQFISQFDIKFIDGTGIDILFRTTTNPIDTGNIRLHLSDKSWIRNSNPPNPSDTIKSIGFQAMKDSTAVIKVVIEANFTTISINSEKYYEAKTNLPATEYIFFETLKGSICEITSLGFLDIKDLTTEPQKYDTLKYGGFGRKLVRKKFLR